VTMRRWTLLASLAAVVAVGAACVPPPAPPPPAPYLDAVFGDVAVTPRDQPLSYGTAAPIDPTVGPGDPHGRPLDGAGNEVLRMWVADPVDNTATNRPAIVWVHGGGFKAGIGAGYGLVANTGASYAQRGYVGFSIEYRVNTTSDCQYVQDHQADNPQPPDWAAKYLYCVQAIVAAQQDTQAAVRWVRRHAPDYGIDPNRVAVAGFSAGAVTAANLAYRWHDTGAHAYSIEDDPSANSRVQAALGASGCEYLPSSIGAGDAPISFIHSEFDQAVDYHNCVVPTVTTARDAGLVAELTSYCDQAGHAQVLYDANRAATDAQWTTFLARELRIYSGMRPPSADPVCT
jgi:predicted esterase